VGGAEQPVGVLLQAENRRALFGLVGAHALEDAHAVVQGVGEDVGGGVAPGNDLAVVPDDAVAVGHGHGEKSLNECKTPILPESGRGEAGAHCGTMSPLGRCKHAMDGNGFCAAAVAAGGCAEPARFDYYLLALRGAGVLRGRAAAQADVRAMPGLSEAGFRAMPLTLHGLWPNRADRKHPAYCGGRGSRGAFCRCRRCACRRNARAAGAGDAGFGGLPGPLSVGQARQLLGACEAIILPPRPR
jgi:hypothetical protein